MKDLSGQTFDKLTVVSLIGISRSGALWRCACACGATSEVPGSRLRAGKSKSCGCGRPAARAKARAHQTGERNPAWRGDGASYYALHQRVYRAMGTPSECSVCKTTNAKRFEWANLTGRYEDVKDYARMCTSCHRRYDNARKRSALSAYDAATKGGG
jgi:hypothetical protein